MYCFGEPSFGFSIGESEISLRVVVCALFLSQLWRARGDGHGDICGFFVVWGIQIGGVATLKRGGGNSGCRGVVEGGGSLC